MIFFDSNSAISYFCLPFYKYLALAIFSTKIYRVFSSFLLQIFGFCYAFKKKTLLFSIFVFFFFIDIILLLFFYQSLLFRISDFTFTNICLYLLFCQTLLFRIFVFAFSILLQKICLFTFSSNRYTIFYLCVFSSLSAYLYFLLFLKLYTTF